MSRFYGKDILDTLKTKLEAEYNNMLSVIRTERKDSELPDIVNFETAWAKNIFPEMLIYLTDSTLTTETLSNDINLSTEIYPGEIKIGLKSNHQNIYYWMEYYIEALKRVLHGYSNENITWIVCKSDIREQLSTKDNQDLFVGGCEIEVRIN